MPWRTNNWKYMQSEKCYKNVDLKKGKQTNKQKTFFSSFTLLFVLFVKQKKKKKNTHCNFSAPKWRKLEIKWSLFRRNVAVLNIVYKNEHTLTRWTLIGAQASNPNNSKRSRFTFWADLTIFVCLSEWPVLESMGMPSLLLIRRVHTHPQAWTVESRHWHRSPPSVRVPCRQSICCQPPDLDTCCWAPSRHRNSSVRFCSRDSVTGRSYLSLSVVSSLKIVSNRQRILLRLLLPSPCRQHSVIFTFVTFCRLSAATVWATL